MRIDKLTTKFQEALGDAQTLALGKDHAYIDPAHVLLAMLQQQDGPKALLQRAGVNMTSLMTAASAAVSVCHRLQGKNKFRWVPNWSS
jgi:ATP-dependent Clp protease ATP-binding subunit ClpB